MQSHSQRRALRLVIARWEQAGRAKRSPLRRPGAALTHLRDAIVIGLLAYAAGAVVDGLYDHEEHGGHSPEPSINVEEMQRAKAQVGRGEVMGIHAVDSSGCQAEAHEG